MNRLLLALAAAVLLALWGADVVSAQAPPAGQETAPAVESHDANWPTYPLNGHEPSRGPGFYLALWKIFLIFFIVWLWVRTTDWVSRDAVALGLSYDKWNSSVFFPFFVAFFLCLWLPWFIVGYLLLLVAYVVPLTIYIRKRNSLVAESDKVMTREHLLYVVSHLGSLFGAKIDTEKKLPHEKGAPVNFHALGGDSEARNQANLIEARQSPAYITLKDLVADAVNKRAEKVLLDYTAEKVGLKYQIDGVWIDMPDRQRDVMDPVAAVIKKLGNRNINDRKSKQEGAFQAEYQGTRYMCPFTSQGTAAGERILLTIAGKGQRFNSIDELGIREKMRDQLKELLASREGIFVFSAMPGGGLSSMMTMALKSTDRLLRDFIAIGDRAKHEPEVENVDLTTIDVAGGETPMSVLPKLILKQPDVLVIRELTDAETLATLAKQCTDDHPKLSITSVRAKEAVEALLRIAALKLPAQEWAPHLLGVLNVRLIRKLCDQCKEPYEPTAELLSRLGIPAGRIQTLYRERQPLPPDSKEKRPPCPQCSDIGYYGRTGIFELLVMNDKLREALIKQPQLEVLKKVARATGHRGLQEEGIALVALGVTSLTELQRVLKQ